MQRQDAEVARAQAALDNAKAAQTRARDLFDRGVAARKEVEDADRAVADAEAALAQARASLGAAQTVAARAIVRATFDGVVAKRFAQPRRSRRSRRRATRCCASSIRDGSRSSRRCRSATRRALSIGAPAPRSPPCQAAAAELGLKVVSRPAAVDAGTATIPVRLAIRRRRRTSPPAHRCRSTSTPSAQTGVVLIPAAAIVREGEETAVFVANDGKARAAAGADRPRPTATHVEIVSGVKAGEMVIVDGQAGLPDGATITIGAPAKPDSRPRRRQGSERK